MSVDYAGWVHGGLKAWATIANSVAKLHNVEVLKVGGKTHIKIDGELVAKVTTEVEP